jgi:hypothetical protein
MTGVRLRSCAGSAWPDRHSRPGYQTYRRSKNPRALRSAARRSPCATAFAKRLALTRNWKCSIIGRDMIGMPTKSTVPAIQRIARRTLLATEPITRSLPLESPFGALAHDPLQLVDSRKPNPIPSGGGRRAGEGCAGAGNGPSRSRRRFDPYTAHPDHLSSRPGDRSLARGVLRP